MSQPPRWKVKEELLEKRKKDQPDSGWVDRDAEKDPRLKAG